MVSYKRAKLEEKYICVKTSVESGVCVSVTPPESFPEVFIHLHVGVNGAIHTVGMNVAQNSIILELHINKSNFFVFMPELGARFQGPLSASFTFF